MKKLIALLCLLVLAGFFAIFGNSFAWGWIGVCAAFSDKLFIFARSRADMVELAFDRCGNLTSRPGSASANSISERIVDAAVDGSDRIEESGSDRDFSLTVAVAHSSKFQTDIVRERAQAVVVVDKFFVVHGILLPDIVSVH